MVCLWPLLTMVDSSTNCQMASGDCGLPDGEISEEESPPEGAFASPPEAFACLTANATAKMPTTNSTKIKLPSTLREVCVNKFLQRFFIIIFNSLQDFF